MSSTPGVRPIRIAVQIDQQHAGYDVLREAAIRAEDAGADVGGFDEDRADALLDAGVTLLVFERSGPPFDLGTIAPWLRWRDARNAAKSGPLRSQSDR